MINKEEDAVLTISYNDGSKKVWIDYAPHKYGTPWDEIVEGLLSFLNTEVGYIIDKSLQEQLHETIKNVSYKYHSDKFK